MFPDKYQPLRLLHDWKESVSIYPVDLKLLRIRNTSHHSRIQIGRLALKVLLSNIKTDTESGGKAGARQGT
jgi:hypothetical protein